MHGPSKWIAIGNPDSGAVGGDLDSWIAIQILKNPPGAIKLNRRESGRATGRPWLLLPVDSAAHLASQVDATRQMLKMDFAGAAWCTRLPSNQRRMPVPAGWHSTWHSTCCKY